MQFLRVNVTFYGAVNAIHDVITTADPIPYSAKIMFDGVGNDKTQQNQTLKDKQNTYIVLPYIKNI